MKLKVSVGTDLPPKINFICLSSKVMVNFESFNHIEDFSSLEKKLSVLRVTFTNLR